MIIHSFILGVDVEDMSDYINTHAADIHGLPILVNSFSDLASVTISDKNIELLRTEAFINHPDYEKSEDLLVKIKAANYKGPIYFVSMLGVIFPCMSYDIYAKSDREDWPAEVTAEHTIAGTITTIHGRKYHVYCGDVKIKSFCGGNTAITLLEPFIYTGGYA